MTICRYFERGCCRFGDRCRFEHVTRTTYNDSYNYNQRNIGNYQQQYGRRETEYSYSNYDNQQRNQKYEPGNNRYEEQQNYIPDRYQENYRYQSPTRYGGQDNQYHYPYKKYYDQREPSYNEYTSGKNTQYSSNYYENENVYNKSQYQWLSDDYRKHSQQNVEHNKNNYTVQDSYRTSTPKGKVPFSFKVPESEIKNDSNTLIKINEEDQLHAEIVKNDAKSWELGGQWPFTCYFPCTDKHGFPGFYDVSPEELRYAAYQAEKDSTYESYVQNFKNALAQVNQQRSALQIPTPELLSTLKKIRNGEDLYSTSRMINPIPTTTAGSVVESMETVVLPVSANNAAASFSFKMPSETDSIPNTSAANFSFKLPVGTEVKVVPAIVPDGDMDIYTPMEKLTDEEKEQFSASTFVLGKIPTRPPPLAFV